ncbi:non-heme haloperoxidase Hpx, partial [mine drainage metagenome]
ATGKDPALSGLVLPDDVTHHNVDTDDGGRIHVIERGQGRPLVLLHGVTLSASIWPFQMADLSEDFRVVALDQRGHGLSIPGKDGFGRDGFGRDGFGEGPSMTSYEPAGSAVTRRMALDLDQVFEALDVHDAVLAGHSMGGMVALEYVTGMGRLAAGDRVSALALVSTSAGPI